MSYAIHIHNQQRRIALNPSDVKKFIQQVLEREKVTNADLSIVFVTDRKIHSINRKFLNHDYPTDVISFDLSEHQLSRIKKHKAREIEGEIYVSVTSASRNAKEFGTTDHDEIMLYVIHGILHLLGYDDHSLDDRKKMRKKEKEILDFVRKMTNAKRTNDKGILKSK